MNPGKAYLALVSIFFFWIGAESGWATSTAAVDAGQLTSPASAPMQVDNTSPSSNGSLLLLIDLGSGNTVDNTLTPGSYVAGTNTVLAAGGFNTSSGGTNETLTVFLIAGGANPGDQIALRWFPQITYAQYQAGAVPAAGDYFGTYDAGGGNPDGGDTWTVPSDGSEIDLHFFTTDSVGGGTQPPASGFAGFQVSASGTSFSAWQMTYFTAEQQGDPNFSGPTATPLNDGVPNLLKYVYDIDPSFPMSAADRAALPAVQVTGNGTVLTLTYRENPAAASDVTVTAETSTDLLNWSAVPSQQTSTDPMTGDLIMQAQVSVSGAHQFLRLDVTSP